jgi:hypothetical protein
MNDVTSLIPSIEKHNKTRQTVDTDSNIIRDMPIIADCTIYQDGALSFSGESRTTVPLLVEFILSTIVGRVKSDKAFGFSSIKFETRDGHVSVLIRSIIADAVIDAVASGVANSQKYA